MVLAAVFFWKVDPYETKFTCPFPYLCRKSTPPFMFKGCSFVKFSLAGITAGDGGTFDIGIQSLSGVAERNENILFVCYDNEAYMNTGIQRSSATPVGAWTTTTPAGSIKKEPKKDIEKIMLGHHIPYMATASIAYPDDMYRKFKKVRNTMGTKFIHVLSPCPPRWGIDASKTVQIARLATQSKVFPIYEVENGNHKINIYPKSDIGVKDYVQAQGRIVLPPHESRLVLQS